MTDLPMPPGQALQSLEPRDYAIRIIVAGTRGYANKREFHTELCEYLQQFAGQNVLFISGAAATGADRLIIDWCKKFGYPCAEFPAFWDTEGKGAGFRRNERMAAMGTHLLAFFDGKSPGTAHMLQCAAQHLLPSTTITIPTPQR